MSETLQIEKHNLDNDTIHRALETTMKYYMRTGLKPKKLTVKYEEFVDQLKLYYNESKTCHTNFRAVFLGLASELFNRTLNENYNMAETVVGHEVSHLRFTSKKDWNSFSHKSSHRYGLLSRYAMDILNITEDRRIERLMALVSEFLERNFFVMGYRLIQDIEKLSNKEIEDCGGNINAEMKLTIIRNGILYISVMRMLPNIKNEEVMEYLKKCYPYVMYARQGEHTKVAVKATEKIMELLKPLKEEYEQNNDEKMKNIFKNRETGSNQPQSENDVSQTNQNLMPTPFSKDMEEKIKEMIKKVQEKMESEEDEEHARGEKGGKLNGDGKTTGDGTEMNDDEMKMGSDDTDVNGDIRDFVDDITGNNEKEDVLREALGEIAQKEAAKMKEPVNEVILSELLKSNKKEKEQNVRTQKEEAFIESLIPNVKKEIHRNCVAEFKKREKMHLLSNAEYRKLYGELKKIIKKTVKEIQKLSQQTIEHTERFQRFGRVDKKSLVNFAAFGDSKIFNSRQIEEEQMKMDIMLLVDVSGSNNHQMLNEKNDTFISRYKMNQIVAILVHEVLKELEFEHTVWTFYEAGGKLNRFSSAIDKSNCFDDDAGRYLAEIGAWGANRDGYAIRLAGEYLNTTSKNDKKLLIVLSDGQPNGSGYSGKSAMEDVKAACEEVSSGGAKVFGIFTGSESENKHFKKMYENPIFCNNESIFDLPDILRDLLIQEFRDYLDGLTV